MIQRQTASVCTRAPTGAASHCTFNCSRRADSLFLPGPSACARLIATGNTRLVRELVGRERHPSSGLRPRPSRRPAPHPIAPVTGPSLVYSQAAANVGPPLHLRTPLNVIGALQELWNASERTTCHPADTGFFSAVYCHHSPVRTKLEDYGGYCWLPNRHL